MPYVEVKNEELIYDRTRNFSGIADFEDVSEISCPTEGSSVEFKAKDKAITSNNNYLNIMPIGINNVYAEYNMIYEVDEAEAQKLANFLESKRGVEPVFFDTDPTVYKKINGYCTNYSINQIDVETFSISASFEVTESPGHLNWTGMNFLNPDDTAVFYVGTNKAYKKNAVVYDQRDELKYQDRLNNFYYCVEDHNSSNDFSSTLEDSVYWTKDFFWSPDVGQNNTVKIDVQRFGDSDGFPLRRKVKQNTASFPINYTFSNINTDQLKGMLHFLESKNGYKRFKHQISAVYNKPKVYVCRKWKHTWNSFDSHNLEVFLEEDPLGIVPDRVPQNEETLSTRVFTEESNLFKQVLGDVPDYWVELEEGIFDLRLGAGCTSIGNYAFNGCINLNGQLRIPGSVTGIGESSFDGCLGFDGGLIVGGNVTDIGIQAFFNCSNFNGDLLIPPNTRYIGDRAFQNCTSFDGRLDVGQSLSGVGISVFQNCNNLKSNLVIPQSLEVIGTKMFRGCTRLYGDLDIPSGVIDIGTEAFYNCRRLGVDVTLPTTTNIIRNNAFYNCDRVYYINIKSLDAPTIVGDPFPLANMPRLKKIRIPINASGYDTAYWNNLENQNILEYSIL